MPLIDKPIDQRAGYQEGIRVDAFQRDLSALATKHGLVGCVLISFTSERVGSRSWGKTHEFMTEMDRLGTQIMTDIDDGRHDPLDETEGRA